MGRIAIACSKKWFIESPKIESFEQLEVEWIYAPDSEGAKQLEEVSCDTIFFPHWGWRISSEIFEKYTCIGFHAAPLPFGRGGSPIQNLILRNFESAPVCAIEIVDGLDEGGIYMSEVISLHGSLGNILDRLSVVIQNMIVYLSCNNIQPRAQEGQIERFSRLTPSDNEILSSDSLAKVYDKIRMVDHDEYPSSKLKLGDLSMEFSDAIFDDDMVSAKVIFRKIDEND